MELWLSPWPQRFTANYVMLRRKLVDQSRILKPHFCPCCLPQQTLCFHFSFPEGLSGPICHPAAPAATSQDVPAPSGGRPTCLVPRGPRIPQWSQNNLPVIFHPGPTHILSHTVAIHPRAKFLPPGDPPTPLTPPGGGGRDPFLTQGPGRCKDWNGALFLPVPGSHISIRESLEPA